MGEENGIQATMPVIPGGYANNGMFGGDGAWWIILLFVLLGGWGNGFGGNGGMNSLYPWMNNSQNINDGFRDQFLGTQITGLQASLNDINMAIMNSQMSNLQAFNGMQAQFAQCCCENRLATAQTQNVVQQEGAATRLAIQNQTQEILDKLCQQEIDALKAQNLELQNRVNMQALAASQTAQTAALVADNTAQTQYIVNRVAPYPIPAYTVANPVTPVTPTT